MPAVADPITVLVVDDHELVRRGIRGFLESQADISVVGEAASGAEAVQLASERGPDVALVDLVMTGMDGVDTIRALRARSPHTRIVVLTSYSEDEHIFPAIRAGALSYLLKDVGSEELADAVRKASRGEAVLARTVVGRLVHELQGPRSAESSPFRELSDRELQVLELIGSGRRNAEIAAELFISEKTVKSHIGSILDKLHLDDRTQAAVYAWRFGLVRRG